MDSPINRTGRVINAPNKLRLHMHADLESDTIAMLPNGTTFRIAGVVGPFYEVYVSAFAKSGFVWKDKSRDGEIYVELVPSYPDAPFPVPPPINPKKPDYTGWGIGGAIVIVIGLLVYACGGPVR